MPEANLTEDSRTVERVEYRIWVEDPDGTKGQAYFLDRVERFDKQQKAQAYADSYNESEARKVPLGRRRRFYVRTIRVVETYEEGRSLLNETGGSL